ncbi:hypothetical protein AYO21_08131 [Fonsecaea monophora]|uniref:F-box domain-containing protein n=1 Tax=Fonsecaea monophora TaxID=254056 RepID=A0A177F003_9EURO|nr:hypothetical protein AYO21_08131 [Fonsecaea monophora]KAH0837212.1 hypothetical protein FOPE_04693 [Fonsecaea pedrosoi]OAG37647.1 hypothetical protein AYO21_08131 [Fonsecaea monophora]
MSAMTMNLEPETQYMVAEALVAEFRWLGDRAWQREREADRHRVLCTLQALRLTCRSLGQAKIIKAAIYEEITLQATTLEFDRLTPTAIMSLAPFVRKVNFLPTPFVTSLDLGAFTRVLWVLSQHESNLPLRCQRHVARQWGDIPTTEAGIAAAFRAHGKQANVDEYLITCGELQCLWTAALRSFQHANSFELLSVFDSHPLDPSEHPGILHCDSCLESKYALFDRTGASEGQMLRTAIQCLASSNAQIKTLSIHRSLAQHFPTWPSASWNLLDLSSLKTFKFPDLEIVEDDDDEHFVERDAAVENCLVQFLRKPLPNLRELSIDHLTPEPRMTLPLLPMGSLAHLRNLTLGGIRLQVSRLATIITSCVALEDISLRDCHPRGPGGRVLEGPGDDAWRPLFDALSQHLNLRRFTIVDEWDAGDSQGAIGAPPNVETETYRVTLYTGMAAHRTPVIDGVWDAAVRAFVERQQQDPQ